MTFTVKSPVMRCYADLPRYSSPLGWTHTTNRGMNLYARESPARNCTPNFLKPGRFLGNLFRSTPRVASKPSKERIFHSGLARRWRKGTLPCTRQERRQYASHRNGYERLSAQAAVGKFGESDVHSSFRRSAKCSMWNVVRVYVLPCLCTHNGSKMKQRKRVTKRAKAPRKVARIEASEGLRRRPRYLPEEWAGMYKPVKKPVTLRLDADVLAWFQRAGRGDHTGINLALRNGMSGERENAREWGLAAQVTSEIQD